MVSATTKTRRVGGVSSGDVEMGPLLGQANSTSSSYNPKSRNSSNLKTSKKFRAYGDRIGYGGHDRTDASGKKFRVEVPKKMLLTIAVVFFAVPLSICGYVLATRVFGMMGGRGTHYVKEKKVAKVEVDSVLPLVEIETQEKDMPLIEEEVKPLDDPDADESIVEKADPAEEVSKENQHAIDLEKNTEKLDTHTISHSASDEEEKHVPTPQETDKESDNSTDHDEHKEPDEKDSNKEQDDTANNSSEDAATKEDEDQSPHETVDDQSQSKHDGDTGEKDQSTDEQESPTKQDSSDKHEKETADKNEDIKEEVNE